VGVLENGVAAVGIEAPAGGVDDFVVAIEGGSARDEIENITILDLRFLICDFGPAFAALRPGGRGCRRVMELIP
jgi:hypothetical protein